MSFLTNGPSVSQSQYNFSPTVGAKSGFGENFAAAFNETTAAFSQFGLEFSLLDEDEKNNDLIYELTGERLSAFPDAIYLYERAAKEAEGETPDELPSHLVAGGRVSPKEYFNAYQNKRKRLAELKKQYPEISTYEEMWGRVKTDAQKKTEIAQRSFRRAGTTGTIGFFAGGMAGAFTYRDPVNLMTLGAGGFGPSIVKRIGTEMGVQAGIEAQNQFFGVAENRRLLGLKHTGGDMAFHIAAASVGGGAFRGLFEGVGAGLKKIGNRDGQAAVRMSMRDLADNLSDPKLLEGQSAEVRAAALANEIDAENAARNPYPNNAAGEARSNAVHNDTRQELESWGTDPFEPVPPHREQPPGAPTHRDYLIEEAEGVIELMRRAPKSLRAKELSETLGEKVESLSRFLKKRGGIVDYGGELAARDVTNRSLPGLIRKRETTDVTSTIDYAKQAAFEAGYFPHVRDYNEISDSDFYDAIAADVWFQGKSARAGEGRPIYTGRAQRAVEDEMRAIDEMAQEYDRMGITADMTPEQVARILDEDRARVMPDERPPQLGRDEVEDVEFMQGDRSDWINTAKPDEIPDFLPGGRHYQTEANKELLDDFMHIGRSHEARIPHTDRASETIEDLTETIDVDTNNAVQRLADEGIEETDEIFDFAVVDGEITLVPRTVKDFLDEFDADENLDAVLEACVK